MTNQPPFDTLPPVQIPVFVTSITDHGAIEGGVAPCSAAFARAIASASSEGGGTVIVPAGRWLTGPIHFRSRIRLHLERGAEVLFSQVHADYLPPVLAHRAGCWVMNFSPLLYARDAEHIAITGEGTLDGRGEDWWDWAKNQSGVKRLIDMVAREVNPSERIFGTMEDAVRPNMLEFVNCRHILFEGFTIKESPAYLIHPVGCENITLRRLTVIGHGPNNDGIDPEYCRNVLIEDCFIDTGDDCVCLKAGRDQDGWRENRPTENVIVRRLRTLRGHGGIVIGSELSSGVRNVWVEDCNFTGTKRGIRIKTASGRGGFVENVRIRSIRMADIINEAIVIHMDYGSVAKNQAGQAFDSTTDRLTRIEKIIIEDVTCDGARRALDLTGDDAQPLRNLEFRNVSIRAKQGPSLVHVHDIVFHEARFIFESKK